MNDEFARFWEEYDSAAEYCAKRGIKGKIGDPLPSNMSADVCEEINAHPDDFERRVSEFAYGLAMEKLNLPDGD